MRAPAPPPPARLGSPKPALRARPRGLPRTGHPHPPGSRSLGRPGTLPPAARPWAPGPAFSPRRAARPPGASPHPATRPASSSGPSRAAGDLGSVAKVRAWPCAHPGRPPSPRRARVPPQGASQKCARGARPLQAASLAASCSPAREPCPLPRTPGRARQMASHSGTSGGRWRPCTPLHACARKLGWPRFTTLPPSSFLSFFLIKMDVRSRVAKTKNPKPGRLAGMDAAEAGRRAGGKRLTFLAGSTGSRRVSHPSPLTARRGCSLSAAQIRAPFCYLLHSKRGRKAAKTH